MEKPEHEIEKSKHENLEDKEASHYQANNSIKVSYLVGKAEKGDNQIIFEKIQDAINKANNDSVIKISHGLYKENLVIKNKILKLEAKDTNSEVYILGEGGPALTIENEGQGNVTLEWLKFAHKGSLKKEVGRKKKNKGGGDDDERKRSDTKSMTKFSHSDTYRNDNELSMAPSTTMGAQTAGGKSSIKVEQQVKSNIESYIYDVSTRIDKFDDKTNCAILIKKGTVIMRNCKVNLNLIVKQDQPFMPAIVGIDQSTLIIKECEMRGSNAHDTLGLLLKNSNLLMKDCVLTHFKFGGACIHVGETNSSKIYSTKITFNGKFGIQLLGKTMKERLSGKASIRSEYIVREEEEPEIIKDCDIEKNDGPGIQIVCPNTCLIKKNTISFNKNGIEVISADPRIYDNDITKNTGNGIMVKSIEGFYSIPIIRNNILRSNRESGILCVGSCNIAKIVNNPEISYNKLCGIKVENQAFPHIIYNKIFKNIFQGVLLVENSSAHIERNQISENIKANIALGGEKSPDTVICHNQILKGRCEGIFMIEAGSAYIRHNLIKQNYDGIIMITSCPEVNNNTIEGNKNSGILVMKDSRPKLYDNFLEANGNVGIFVRDNCKFWRTEVIGQEDLLDDRTKPITRQKFYFYGNIVRETPVALVVERKISDGKEIVAQNDFQKLECRIPYTLREMKCKLI